LENGHCEKIPQDVWVTLSKSQSAFTDNSNTSAIALSELKGIYTNHLLPLIRQFRDWGQRQSPTFKYWNMPLKIPDFWQMANSPASNAALISTGILSMSSKYTGVHLE
jgi:hypothetical protein